MFTALLVQRLVEQDRLDWDQPAYPVFATATDRFFYKLVDAELEFLRDERGAVHELVLHQAGEHRAPRIAID